MAQSLYPFYTITYIGLLIWAIFLWFRSSSLSLAIIFALIVGLLYDNAVIGYGIYIGEGDLLLNMNRLRFLLHALLTPLLILAALDQSKRFGVATAGKRWLQVIFLLLTIFLIGIGLARFANLDLVPAYFSGTLRYVDSTARVPLSTIVTLIVVVILGVVIWYKGHWAWLFASALVMFVSSVIPAAVVGPTVGSAAEIVLLLGFLFTEKELKDRNNVQELVTTISE